MFAFPTNFPFKMLILCFTVILLCWLVDRVYATPFVHTLYGEVNNHNTQPIIKALYTAKPEDTLTLHIRSCRGDTPSALQLIKAMHESKAGAVVVYVHPYAYGMAALIALEADTVLLDADAALDFAIVNDNQKDSEVIKSSITPGHCAHVIWNIPYTGMYITDARWPILAQVE